jgi:hypothetical protein
VLVALVDQGGLSRADAYAIVQAAALRAADERQSFRAVLAADPRVTAVLDAGALTACFDEGHLLRNVPAVIARLDRLTGTGVGARADVPAGDAPGGNGTVARSGAPPARSIGPNRLIAARLAQGRR